MSERGVVGSESTAKPDLPAALLALEQFLIREGFTRRVMGPFGNYSDFCITLQRGKLVVAVASDRGWWSVLASCAGWREGFEPFVWRMCLTDGFIPAVDPTVEGDAAWLQEHLDHLFQAIDTWAGRRRLRACLRDSRRRANLELLTPVRIGRAGDG